MFKPFTHSLYVDLAHDPDQEPQPIYLGFRSGRNVVLRFLEGLRPAGVHHIMLNLKYRKRDAAEVLEKIGRHILSQLEASQPPGAPNRTRAGQLEPQWPRLRRVQRASRYQTIPRSFSSDTTALNGTRR